MPSPRATRLARRPWWSPAARWTALNRDELQGVIGHEFSHILNGDMRLNLRLMGVLGGILLLTTLGRIARVLLAQRPKGSSFVLLGFGLIAIGYVGGLSGA